MARTTSNSEQKPLAAYWSPPSLIPGTDQGPGRPIACVATTYTFSAELFETDLLPRFLGLEFDAAERTPAFVTEREEELKKVVTATVLVDQKQVDVRQTSLRWDQVIVRVPRAIQHAKVVLLVWERLIRLMVGSANLSLPGYRHNREVMSVLDFFDDPASTPKLVLTDALQFLDQVLPFASAEPIVRSRIRDGVENARIRAKQWQRMPRNFTPREYPRVHFVSNMPHVEGGVARSVLKQLKELWGNRTARDIRVMTPFVGNPDSKFEGLIKTVAELPHLLAPRVTLAVPGVRSEAESRRYTVPIPPAFRDAWKETWKLEDDFNVCVVLPEDKHQGRPVERPLHAKAIFLGDDNHHLLCCGSSNFSVSGLGIGRANLEANLVYVDRAGSKAGGVFLEDRLPVDWAGHRVQRLEWQDQPETTDEESDTGDQDPACFFCWASLDPATSTLRVFFDVNQPPPHDWCLRWNFTESLPLTSMDQHPTLPTDGILKIEVSKAHLDFMPTSIKVSCQYDSGQVDYHLPIQVTDRKDLPAPAELQSLTAENILACLLSGCSVPQWIDREQSRLGRSPTHADNPAIDPHQVNDPSGLALYQVRRLGRGLAAMGRRLVDSVRTPEAVEYLVHRNPLGPVRLAEALLQDANTTGLPSKLDRARLIFSLLEIGLMLAHAGKRLHKRRQAGEADFRPCIRRGVSLILAKADELLRLACVDAESVTANMQGLKRYRKSVEERAIELLDNLEVKEDSPCL